MSTPIIAVFGATGAQGGSVVRYLKENGGYRVRALTRNLSNYDGPADEAAAADLDDAHSVSEALKGAYGVFLVTNFWQEGTDETAQAKTAIGAARRADIKHFVWSSLPDVAAISNGKWEVPHFTNKARIDPINPNARVIHMAAIAEFGSLVDGAFSNPDKSNGKTLSMAAGLYSFADIAEAYNSTSEKHTVLQVSQEAYAGFYPGAGEIGQMLGYFEDHTYMGPNASQRLDDANDITSAPFTPFAEWLATNISQRSSATNTDPLVQAKRKKRGNYGRNHPD